MSERLERELEMLRKEVPALRQELEENGIRLTLAHGWIQVLREAYDALLHWGINFKALKEYGDGYPSFNGTSEQDHVDKLPISKAQRVYVDWFRKVTNAIKASVRRKQWKVHDNPPTDTTH